MHWTLLVGKIICLLLPLILGSLEIDPWSGTVAFSFFPYNPIIMLLYLIRKVNKRLQYFQARFIFPDFSKSLLMENTVSVIYFWSLYHQLEQIYSVKWKIGRNILNLVIENTKHTNCRMDKSYHSLSVTFSK